LLAAFAIALSGCGGGADGDQPSDAIVGLYVIDHNGEEPRKDALAPYTEAFGDVQQGCEGTPDKLASDILNVATDASNGSGTTVTNLDALRAAASSVGSTPQDCAGLFVGVEARLEGAALAG
jgi:hypothetical protein